MKKHLAIYLFAVVAATSCGSMAQYAAAPQQFEDGIYATPGSAAPEAAVTQEEMDALVRESVESEVNDSVKETKVNSTKQKPVNAKRKKSLKKHAKRKRQSKSK